MKHNICVVGLGYVGLVTAVKFANLNNEVIGVETDKSKLNLLNNGLVPFYEPGLENLFQDVMGKKKLSLTNNMLNIKKNVDIIMICVGTPSKKDGQFDFSAIEKVSEQIIKFAGNIKNYFLIVMRSTVLPGVTRKFFLDKIISKTDLKVNIDFDIVMNPEFLREGSALSDFDNPERTILGASGSKANDILKDLYKSINAPSFFTSVETAELSKYIDNAWHALKITFGNEIGSLVNKLNLDSEEIHKIFISDKKLNISASYLKPGFAFGGSCLPKDVNAINNFIKNKSIKAPILGSIIKSNKVSINRLIEMVVKINKNSVGILGLTFKENTNDCRESPIIEVIDSLILKSKKVFIYDEILKDKNYLHSSLKQNYNFCSSIDNCILNSEIVIITHKKLNYIKEILNISREKIVIDIIGISEIKKMKNVISFN